MSLRWGNEWTKRLKELETENKRLRKFEQIVEEIIDSRYFSTMDNRYLREVKQKYFPKEETNEYERR